MSFYHVFYKVVKLGPILAYEQLSLLRKPPSNHDLHV